MALHCVDRRVFSYLAFLLLSGLQLVVAGSVTWAAPTVDDPLDTQQTLKSKNKTASVQVSCLVKPPLEDLSLVDAVSFALCHNTQTRAAWANALSEAARVGSAKSAYLPTVTGSASGTKAASFASNIKSSSKASSASLSAAFLLYDFGRREATVTAAHASMAAANLSHDAAIQEVLFGTLTAYYRRASAAEALIAAVEAERLASESYQAARLRHKLGQASMADELQAKSSQAQAALARHQAESQVLISQAELARQMGLAPDIDLKVGPPSNNRDADLAFDGTVHDMMETAKKHRPDLAAQAARLAASRASLEARAIPESCG